MSDQQIDCELCREDGGEIFWRDAHCRVVLVRSHEAAAFPGFCRVIWNEHVSEFSDLSQSQRIRVMNAVFLTEHAVRRACTPDKVNVASLGNMTPHLHWHVIPRWRDDSHFPAPIWANARRSAPARAAPSRDALHAAFSAGLLEFFAGALD